MQKQVEKSHYNFDRYISKKRWASMWHQLNEVIKWSPSSVLEIGPGPGVFKANAALFNIPVETLDIDPELEPDHVASAFDTPFQDNTFDVVCAFQVLEHLPFDDSLKAFKEMSRIAAKAVVISLPDAAVRWPISVYIPRIGVLSFLIPRPRLRTPEHRFDGQHFWEINKLGFSYDKIKSDLTQNTSVELARTFRVPEFPYHRFMVFKKIRAKESL